MVSEFKKFIARGNVLDLAIGVIIGASFGRIVTSLNESMIMPVIGWLFGDVDFSNWFIRLGDVPADYTGSADNYVQLKEAGVPMIGYGDFLTQTLDFLIIAIALFLLLRTMNRVMDEMQEKVKGASDSSESADIPTDPQLDVLREILAEMREGKAPVPDKAA